MNSEQLTELLIDEIKDIYHAEKQLLKALPKIAKACDSQDLGEAVKGHLEETQNQVVRLEKVFELLNTPAKGKPCKGMQGLLEEGSEAMEDEEAGPIRDLAIIGAAQRVEHYEISAYGTARALAEQIGNSQIAKLLLQTENEEKAADEKLSEVAKVIYASDEPKEEDEAVMAGSNRARSSSKRK
jgi:ferritin-like metal-binding protein YciE